MHRLVGYDVTTDRARVRFDIKDQQLSKAKKIAHVSDDDPEAAWSYPLSKPQADTLAKLIGVTLEPEGAEFFLEAFVEAEPG